MADLKSKSAIYEELLRAPDDRVAEIVEGELFTTPRPAPRHAHATSALISKLGPAFAFGEGGPGGWWIIIEPELHLGEHVLVPDLAGWRREHMPALPEAAWFEPSPDWICEVVSPATSRLDRVRKLPVYAGFPISWCWLVDPLLRNLEVYRLAESHWLLETTHAENDLVRAAPFEAVEIDLLALWGEQRP